MIFILSRQEKKQKKHHSYQGETKWCKSVKDSEFKVNKGNNKITELRTILQRESPNS